MQRRYVAVRGASLAGGAFQSWLGDILGSRPTAGRSVLGEQAVGDILGRGRMLGEFGKKKKPEGGALVWRF